MKPELQRLLNSDTLTNPDVWRNLQQEEAVTLRKALEGQITFWRWPAGIARKALCLLGLFLVGYLLGVAAHLSLAPSHEDLWQPGGPLRQPVALGVMLLPAAFILMTIVCNIAKGMVAHRREWLLAYLQPLSSNSHQDDCSRALLLVELSQGCARYRDDVLANGRQLLAGDLQIMEEINRAEVRERQISSSEQACKMLHRLHPT